MCPELFPVCRKAQDRGLAQTPQALGAAVLWVGGGARTPRCHHLWTEHIIYQVVLTAFTQVDGTDPKQEPFWPEAAESASS